MAQRTCAASECAAVPASVERQSGARENGSGLLFEWLERGIGTSRQ